MKNHNRIIMISLAFVLVLSLIFTGTAAALNVRDTASVGTSDYEIERGVAWEMLNSKVYDTEDLMHAVGNDFSNNYYAALRNYIAYAKSLLNSPESSTAELNEMYDDLCFIIDEQRNPANHARFGHYTVVFTNNGSWSDPIYFYKWSDDGGEISAWPGEAVNSTYTNEYGQKQYYTFIPMDVPNIVISSNQLESADPNYGVPCVRVQTEDITVLGNTGFYLTGARDGSKYKVAEWELKDPVYKTFNTSDPDPDPTQPTEAPTQKPTVTPTEAPTVTPTQTPTSPTTIPTEVPTQAPTVKPTVITTDPTEPTTAFDIDDYLPRYDGMLDFYEHGIENDVQKDLRELIVNATGILSPGNNHTSEYIEKLMRLRNFAVTVYNDNRAEGNELLGAKAMLQAAIDNKSFEEIVDIMYQWFNMPDIEGPDPTTGATEAPTSAPTNTYLTQEERAYNQLKDSLEARAFSIKMGSQGAQDQYHSELGRLLADVRHSIYDLNGREFVSDNWSEKIALLNTFKTSMDIYTDASSTENDCQYILGELNLAYFGLIPPEGYEEDPITNHIIGDADGDGAVTVLDATRIQRVLAGYDSNEKAKAERFAALSDGVLSILDATSIQRWLAGFTTPYAIGSFFPANRATRIN